MPVAPQQPADDWKAVLNRFMRIKAGMLLVVALSIAALSWLVTGLLAGIAADQGVEPSRFARWCLDRPPAVALLALPAILCALAGLKARRLSWLLVVLVGLASLIPVAVVLLCFLEIITPMYQYQPL